MGTSIAELEQWMLTSREGAVLEFKEARSQYDTTKLFRYCVALANEGGGHLILGVTDKPPRRVVGTTAFGVPDKIAEKILDKVGFRVDVEELSHPDGRVVIFHIPSRPTGMPYDFEGAYLMRSGERLVPMTQDRLRQIFDEGKPDWLSWEAKKGCSGDDVVRLLDTQSYFDLLKLPYPRTQEAVLARFEQERLIMRDEGLWVITNLGAILFAKSLDDFDSLSRKAVRVIVYEGTDKLRGRLDEWKQKGYAAGFDTLVDFINGLIPTNEIIRKALREEIPMFPEIAVRELIANALIHQDLGETGSFVTVELYSDRMEISNPGEPSIPTDRFIDEYKSRNENLADLMRRLRICEEKGSGIDKVIDAVEAYQLPAPRFHSSERRTQVTLFASISFKDMDRADRIRACYQHCCLCYVMNRQMTNQSLRERFGLPQSQTKTATVSQIISATVQAGKVKPFDETIASTRYKKYVPFWA